MIIMAIALILLFIGMNIKSLVEVGFPDYVSHPGLSFIENINHSDVINPYVHIFIILLLSKVLYTMGKSYYIDEFLATEITYGTITSIKYSSNRVNNKPLVDIEVEYMKLTGTFKDQPGDFGFYFKKGDLIPVKYQRGKSEVAKIPVDAIEIIKQHPSYD